MTEPSLLLTYVCDSTSSFADFSLLTYLPHVFDVDSAIVTAAAVRENTPVPDGIQVVLEAMME